MSFFFKCLYYIGELAKLPNLALFGCHTSGNQHSSQKTTPKKRHLSDSLEIEGEKKTEHFSLKCSFSELRRAFAEIFGSLESYGSLLCENICFSSSRHTFGYYFAKRELNLRFPECHITEFVLRATIPRI